jgi:hypothetical protein
VVGLGLGTGLLAHVAARVLLLVEYSWIVSGVFGACIIKRRHYSFGNPVKDCLPVGVLFRFWNQAQRGEHCPLYVANGLAGSVADVTAPIAAYNHTDICESGSGAERLILMQHGSYHIDDIDSQPLVGRQTSYPRRPFAPSPSALSETSIPASTPLRTPGALPQKPARHGAGRNPETGEYAPPRRHGQGGNTTIPSANSSAVSRKLRPTAATSFQPSTSPPVFPQFIPNMQSCSSISSSSSSSLT